MLMRNITPPTTIIRIPLVTTMDLQFEKQQQQLDTSNVNPFNDGDSDGGGVIIHLRGLGGRNHSLIVVSGIDNLRR